MTAGSCSVAISRSRPPQCGHARTSIANARCINAAQLQARERSCGDSAVNHPPDWHDQAIKGLCDPREAEPPFRVF
jgi:hypothetical protein